MSCDIICHSEQGSYHAFSSVAGSVKLYNCIVQWILVWWCYRRNYTINLCHIIDLQSSYRSLILYILLPLLAHNSNFKATENKDNSVVVWCLYIWHRRRRLRYLALDTKYRWLNSDYQWRQTSTYALNVWSQKYKPLRYFLCEFVSDVHCFVCHLSRLAAVQPMRHSRCMPWTRWRPHSHARHTDDTNNSKPIRRFGRS